MASFTAHPGVGRVLCVGEGEAEQASEILHDAKYHVGRLAIADEPDEVIRSASSFLPDIIYFAIGDGSPQAFSALEALAADGRTRDIPLIALLSPDASPVLVDEAYSRSGCDFFRCGHTQVELLARTHMLIKMHRRNQSEGATRLPPAADGFAANEPAAGRFDLRDPITGLYSAGYLFHRLPTEISRARRYNRPLSVMVYRCEKAATDDLVAVRVARILGRHLRRSDVSARVDTTVFVALLPETAVKVLDRLTTRIGESLAQAGIEGEFGLAGLDEEGDYGGHSPETLLESARTNLKKRDATP